MARNLFTELGGASGSSNYQPKRTPLYKSRNLFTELAEATFVGTPELLGSLVSGMATWPISKLAGLGSLAIGKSAEEAKGIEERVVEKLAYQPRTKSGAGAAELVGKGFHALLTPARMAGQGMTDLVGPKTGYIAEFASELATFKMVGGARAKGSKTLKQRAAAKDMLNKKMADLTTSERFMVEKIADTKAQPRNLVKEKRETKVDPLEEAYETQKDIWLGKRDVRMFEADIEARLLKKELKAVSNKKQGRMLDEAVQVYIDTKRNQTHP